MCTVIKDCCSVYYTMQTQLSEEDLVLQERVNKLTEGISLLINSQYRKWHCPPAPQLNPTRTVSSGTPRKQGKAVHWEDIDALDKTSSSESEPNLSASCPMPIPIVTVSSSTSTEISVVLNGEEDESKEETRRKDEVSTHKILHLSGLESCSSIGSPPPICTIVIEEPDGHTHCHTPLSVAEDEVFVL